jgi:hypothetical protein
MAPLRTTRRGCGAWRGTEQQQQRVQAGASHFRCLQEALLTLSAAPALAGSCCKCVFARRRAGALPVAAEPARRCSSSSADAMFYAE